MEALYIFRQIPYTFNNGPAASPETLDNRWSQGDPNMTSMIVRMFAALLILLASFPGVAGEAQDNQAPVKASQAAGSSVSSPPVPSESRWRLGIALGYGLRTNPLVQSDDIPIIVDIDISWFGDRFFFDNGDLGFTFLDNEFVTTSLVGRINSDRVFFGRTNTKFVVTNSLSPGLTSV